MKHLLKTEYIAVVVKAYCHIFDVQNRMAFRKYHLLLTHFHTHFLRSVCRGWPGFRTTRPDSVLRERSASHEGRTSWTSTPAHPFSNTFAVTVFCSLCKKSEKVAPAVLGVSKVRASPLDRRGNSG